MFSMSFSVRKQILPGVSQVISFMGLSLKKTNSYFLATKNLLKCSPKI